MAGRILHLAGRIQPRTLRRPLAGRVPSGKVINELVHEVDLFTTLVLAGGGTVPDDRHIDGLDMRAFLLGGADASGRDAVLCLQGNRLQAIKWRQWKMHVFQQDVAASSFVPYNAPHLHNLEWDPREEHEIGSPHGRVIRPWPKQSPRSSNP